MSKYITKERAKESVQCAINRVVGGCPGQQKIRDSILDAIDKIQGEDISPRKVHHGSLWNRLSVSQKYVVLIVFTRLGTMKLEPTTKQIDLDTVLTVARICTEIEGR